jgi:hypothetical protein
MGIFKNNDAEYANLVVVSNTQAHISSRSNLEGGTSNGGKNSYYNEYSQRIMWYTEIRGHTCASFTDCQVRH